MSLALGGARGVKLPCRSKNEDESNRIQRMKCHTLICRILKNSRRFTHSTWNAAAASGILILLTELGAGFSLDTIVYP